MKYDTIIIEMLSRIQALENRVSKLESDTVDTKSGSGDKLAVITTTDDIRNYIMCLKKNASDNNETSLTLTARFVHGALGLKQRYPMVCNAMRQVMKRGDEIVFSPKSGYSSTLEIKYYL